MVRATARCDGVSGFPDATHSLKDFNMTSSDLVRPLPNVPMRSRLEESAVLL